MKAVFLINGRETRKTELKTYTIRSETISRIVRNAADRYRREKTVPAAG